MIYYSVDGYICRICFLIADSYINRSDLQKFITLLTYDSYPPPPKNAFGRSGSLVPVLPAHIVAHTVSE